MEKTKRTKSILKKYIYEKNIINNTEYMECRIVRTKS